MLMSNPDSKANGLREDAIDLIIGRLVRETAVREEFLKEPRKFLDEVGIQGTDEDLQRITNLITEIGNVVEARKSAVNKDKCWINVS